MDNVLDNGTVLPFGLLGANSAQDLVVGFNRSYKNTSLKAGIVIQSYASDSPYTKTGLCTEYDVQVIEQFEDKGTTSQIYRNCLSTQGFGSIADYFEYNLRPLTEQSSQGTPSFKGQNGAVALVQCLDGIGEKALIVGYLIHPDRPTNIEGTDPQLFGSYNGIAIKINQDGSCSLVFNGATDNDGTPTDSSQGVTEFQIQTDGSYQFMNSGVTIIGNKSGILTINTTGDANITTGGNTNITVSGDCNVESSGKTVITASEVDLNGSSGEVLTNMTDPVIDTIFGEPTVGVPTVKSG